MTSDDVLSRYEPGTRSRAEAVIRMLHERLPGAKEQPDSTANVIGFGYGDGYKGLICTLILSKKGVKLGFSGGAGLPDPEGLLAGAGKVHRYVEIGSVAEADTPALRELVDAAKAAHAARQG